MMQNRCDGGRKDKKMRKYNQENKNRRQTLCEKSVKQGCCVMWEVSEVGYAVVVPGSALMRASNTVWGEACSPATTTNLPHQHILVPPLPSTSYSSCPSSSPSSLSFLFPSFFHSSCSFHLFASVQTPTHTLSLHGQHANLLPRSAFLFPCVMPRVRPIHNSINTDTHSSHNTDPYIVTPGSGFPSSADWQVPYWRHCWQIDWVVVRKHATIVPVMLRNWE